MLIVIKYFLLKLECGVDEYLCFSHSRTININVIDKRVLEAFFDTVYVKLRVCFTIVQYENDTFSLCETSNAFIHAFCHLKSIFISADC